MEKLCQKPMFVFRNYAFFSMFANKHAELYVAENFSPEPMLQLKDYLLGCEVFVDILRPD